VGQLRFLIESEADTHCDLEPGLEQHDLHRSADCARLVGIRVTAADLGNLFNLLFQRSGTDMVLDAEHEYTFDGWQIHKSVYGGGTVQWADVLWNNHIIGNFSSQGILDSAHTLVPSLHNFTYDVYFWVKDASVSQALEFDINQYTGGKHFIWGHECRIAGGHEWDVWDNVNKHWVATGVPCYPLNGAWNHLIIQVQRTSSDQLLYQSISLNGKTVNINRYENPTGSSSNGITINYQLDGNRYGSPYTVYIDKLNFTVQ